MKKIITLTLTAAVFLFICSNAGAQIIKGHVYDSKTYEPIAGAFVSYTMDDTYGTSTDPEGYYELKLSDGGFDLVFSFMGYENVKLPIIIGRNETLVKDIYMKESTELLSDVVVTAGRFEQKLSEVTVSMDVLKSEAITRQAPTDLSATLKTIPGVDIVDKQPSIRGGGGWTYGVGARSQILVDGMSVLNPQNGEISWNTVSMDNVDQVEVIKGASSVLYGSSALNGIINVITSRPSIEPKTHFSMYFGIYDDPSNSNYIWYDKSFWSEGKYPVRGLLRRSIFSGVRNPMYEGYDLSHTRRIGNFDLSGSFNYFTDEGYRMQGYDERVRLAGRLTYHQPSSRGNYVNYGFNISYLSYKSSDFIIWRSTTEAYEPSVFSNFGREVNDFTFAPFFNFTNPSKGTSHKLKARFYYSGSSMDDATDEKTITDILGNMGVDLDELQDVINNTDWSTFATSALSSVLSSDWSGLVALLLPIATTIAPDANTGDLCDLIGWLMNHGLPKELFTMLGDALSSTDYSALSSTIASMGDDKETLMEWLSGVVDGIDEDVPVDRTYNVYADYQFSKEFNPAARLTFGATYDHVHYNSGVMDKIYDTDNASLYVQYDHRFWDRLSISAGMRLEYYRVNKEFREAETEIFGVDLPFRPVFRAGVNYKVADYSFLRASFGQGYRYPSLVEKFLLKDVGGVGVFPNPDLKAERGFNAEIGFKQGYKIGKVYGFADLSAFYTQYKDMIEFSIGLFDSETYEAINSLATGLTSLMNGTAGIGAQFHNVSKAIIYGAEFSTTGWYPINKNATLSYTFGYTYTEPLDADYKDRNELEATYTDPLQMKEKSNESKYLKYRNKHSLKATLDFEWKRISVGTNLSWRSKVLAVDYFMVDEREKESEDLMDIIRYVVMGYSDGTDILSYWTDINKGIFTADLRFGVKATDNVSFQFMVNNVFNKEYCNRPMCVEAPRTYVFKLNIDL